MNTFATLLTIGACSMSAIAAQRNILPNGHFEDLDADGNMADGWGNWGNTGVYAFWVGVPHATIWGDLIDNNGGYFYGGIKAKPGAEYTFKINNMMIETNFNANLRMVLEWWDEGEANLLREDVLVIDSNEELGDVQTGTGLRFSLTQTAPEGAAYVRPLIRYDGAFPVETEQLNAFVFSVSLLTDAEEDQNPTGCPADFNGDGSRTVQDLLAFLSAFRAGCAATN